MKQKQVLLSLLLVLALLLCLLPATALAASAPETADSGEGTDVIDEEVLEEAEALLAEEIVETAEDIAAAEEAPAEEAEEAGETLDPAEDAAEEAEPEGEEANAELLVDLIVPDMGAGEDAPVGEIFTVEAEDSFFALAGDTVYNNGGVIYNNGGVVYNNGGTVYNNGGTVYNNGGEVYTNGGKVYNNVGTVYNNNGTVYNFKGNVEASLIYGYFRLTLPEEGPDLVQLEGLDEGEDGSLLIRQDATCVLRPLEGYRLLDVEADAGTLAENEDGSFSLSGVDADVTLRYRLQPAAPVLSLEPGTYAEAQTLEITGPEGAEIYYSLDGRKPDADNSLLYEGPLTLEEGAVVTAMAVVEGAEAGESASAAYAIVTVTAPVFEDAEEGYARPAAQAISIENSGSVAAMVTAVALEGENAEVFDLTGGGTGKINPGATSTKWTVRPAGGLEAGSYSARVVFTFDSGSTAEVPIQFTVA